MLRTDRTEFLVCTSTCYILGYISRKWSQKKLWHEFVQERQEGSLEAVPLLATCLAEKWNKKDGYRQLNVRQLGSLCHWEHRGKCHTVGKRIQCLLNASLYIYIYPSIFNSFPVIQAWSLKIRHFSTSFCTFWLPCVRPWDNRGKCHTVGKRIQCNTFAAIYLRRLSEVRTQGRPKCAKNVLMANF